MIDVLNVIFNLIPDQKIHYVTISKLIKININHDLTKVIMDGDLYSLHHTTYDYKNILYRALMNKQINIVNYIIHKHDLSIYSVGMTFEQWFSKDKYLYDVNILKAIGYCGDESLIRKICCENFYYTAYPIKSGILRNENHALLDKLIDIYEFT